MSRTRARSDALHVADQFRIDLRRVWPRDGTMITVSDVLDHAVGWTPDRMSLADASGLEPDAPVDRIQAILNEYLATLGGPPDD